MSLPVWVEWIEVRSVPSILQAVMSLPVWVEWIEVTDSLFQRYVVCVSTRLGRVD